MKISQLIKKKRKRLSKFRACFVFYLQRSLHPKAVYSGTQLYFSGNLIFVSSRREAMETMRSRRAGEQEKAEPAKSVTVPVDAEGLAYWQREFRLSVDAGELALFESHWQPTTSGLLRIAMDAGCAGISSEIVSAVQASGRERVVVRATVFRSQSCRGISALAEAEAASVPKGMENYLLAVAETRAINRAIRRCYLAGGGRTPSARGPKENSEREASASVQRQDLQIVSRALEEFIERERLDPASVRNYAAEYCHAAGLSDRSGENLDRFISMLAGRLQSDRAAVLCELSSYAAVNRAS